MTIYDIITEIITDDMECDYISSTHDSDINNAICAILTDDNEIKEEGFLTLTTYGAIVVNFDKNQPFAMIDFLYSLEMYYREEIEILNRIVFRGKNYTPDNVNLKIQDKNTHEINTIVIACKW